MAHESPINLYDVEALGRSRLDLGAVEYIAGGAEDEATLAANRVAFERVFLRPRVLVDVEKRSLATTVLGTPVSSPVLIAPTGFQRLAHAEGELATARAAERAGTLMVVSTFATTRLEDVRAATEAPLWFQLYVHRDRGFTRALVERAAAAGYRAIVLTVDTPVLGRRERDIRNAFALPPALRVANFELPPEAMHESEGESALAAFHRGLRDPSFSWKDLEWLATLTRLPIVLKGVLRSDDTRRAAEHGVRGVIVSNHGGRQLDAAVPTLVALPEVVEAAEDQLEVLMDGGIRRGTDVIKAMALGARAVLLGRPVLWALAWDGEDGVVRALELLREELDTAMALVGAAAPTDITKDLIA